MELESKRLLYCRFIGVRVAVFPSRADIFYVFNRYAYFLKYGFYRELQFASLRIHREDKAAAFSPCAHIEFTGRRFILDFFLPVGKRQYKIFYKINEFFSESCIRLGRSQLVKILKIFHVVALKIFIRIHDCACAGLQRHI